MQTSIYMDPSTEKQTDTVTADRPTAHRCTDETWTDTHTHTHTRGKIARTRGIPPHCALEEEREELECDGWASSPRPPKTPEKGSFSTTHDRPSQASTAHVWWGVVSSRGTKHEPIDRAPPSLPPWCNGLNNSDVFRGGAVVEPSNRRTVARRGVVWCGEQCDSVMYRVLSHE